LSRHLTSDHHAKLVSAISATTGTFHFLRGPRDSPAQTGRSHAYSKRQSSLWEKSLSPSPGQLGSIPRLNGNRAETNSPWLAGRDSHLAGDSCCSAKFWFALSELGLLCIRPERGSTCEKTPRQSLNAKSRLHLSIQNHHNPGRNSPASSIGGIR
jgi:hypothetical protein